MAAEVDIWNMALRQLGAAPLTATTDDVESARILDDIYDMIRDEVLTAHPWNFAVRRATLTELGGVISTWTASGTTNVWQAALTTEPAVVKFDGTTGTEQASVAGCDTEYYWYWASNVLYVYSTSDPDTAYTTIFAQIPEFDYDYAFSCPTDYLRIIRTSLTSEEFKIENDRLFTDESSVKVLYIAQITDTTEFPAYFISALATRLAAEIAYPITNSTTLAEAKLKEYQIKLKQAKQIDGQEGTLEKQEDTSWIDSRE